MRCKSLLALIPAGIISAGTVNTKDGTLPAATRAINLPTLVCENNDLFTISSHGTDFYACYTDVFPSPADTEHTRRVYETMGIVGKVKQYEQEALGFSESRNYREYRPGNASQLVEEGSAYFMLYIIPQFLISVETETRTYIPTAGEYRAHIEEPVLLDSHADDLSDEEAYFKAEGYDVFRRVVVDFSSGDENRHGCSITDFFMKDSLEREIELVIHEDFHYNRRFVWGHGYARQVEEPVAALVGFAGAVDFARIEFGIGSEAHEKARSAFGRWRRRVSFTNRYYEELSELYAMDISREEMAGKKQEILSRAAEEWKEITGKDAVIDNAFLMRDLPYTWLFPNAYKVYEAHPSIGELVMILKDTPVDEDKAVEYLERFSTSQMQRSNNTRHLH